MIHVQAVMQNVGALGPLTQQTQRDIIDEQKEQQLRDDHEFGADYCTKVANRWARNDDQRPPVLGGASTWFIVQRQRATRSAANASVGGNNVSLRLRDARRRVPASRAATV